MRLYAFRLIKTIFREISHGEFLRKELRQAKIFKTHFNELLSDNKRNELDKFLSLTHRGLLQRKIYSFLAKQ
jgi:hypothetical protein